MENYVGVIVAFITGVIGPILVLYIKSKLEKKEKPDMVKETLRVSELVTNKIEHRTRLESMSVPLPSSSYLKSKS